MKPLRMTMAAFGPFASEQSIDFESLSEQGIFLITGPTGAGKTSIFDALTFALYGTASGESRQSENFKSDYADDTTLCSVELVFLLKNETYKIRRSPKQIRLTRRNTQALMPESAELLLPNGEAVSGPKEVDQKINELIGLDVRQFKQIVMLPQGEFRKLIEANSNEKLEIFRKIFKTQLYNQIAERLSEKSKETEQTLNLKTERVSTLCGGLYTGEDAELAELVKERYIDLAAVFDRTERVNVILKERLKNRQEKMQALQEQISAIRLDEAEVLNKKIEEAKKVQSEYARLLDKKEAYEQAGQRLVLQKKAYEVSLTEKEKTEKEQDLARLSREAAVCRVSLADKQKEFEKVQSKYALTDQKQAEREETAKQKASYESLAKRAETLDEYRKKAAELKAGSEKKQTSLDRCILLLERASLQTEWGKKIAVFALLEQSENKIRDFNKRVKEEQRLEELYQLKRKLYLSFTAAMLAEKLEEGRPCPVCGAKEHPAKACFGDEAPTKQELDDLLKEKDAVSSQVSKARSDLLFVFSKLQEQEEYREAVDAANLPESMHNISRCKEELQVVLTKLKAEMEKKQRLCLEFLSKAELDHPRYADENFLKEKIAELEKTIESIGSSVKTLEETILRAEEKEPLSGLKKADIQHCIEKLFQKEESLKREIAATQQGYLEMKSAVDKLEEKLHSTQEYRDSTEKLTKMKAEDFIASLKKNGFSTVEEYKNLVQPLPVIENSEKEINRYHNALDVARATYTALQQAVEGKVPQDIEALKEKQRELSTEQKQINRDYMEDSARLKMNETYIKELRPLGEQLVLLNRQYADISKLQNIANGNNLLRLKFETYILISYFDEIISFANARFNKMTNYRYFLKRKEEKEKFGRQSGLDLEIVDTYTGKNRNVNTLSGGEGFKASLSLALGLADVVQGISGGVEVNTLFIDEGFGTLDPQSLDNAVETLMGLKTAGRMIGIISHVPELKEKLKCKIDVTPTNKGSTAEIIS